MGFFRSLCRIISIVASMYFINLMLFGIWANNISPHERFIEKILLGAVGLVLSIVVFSSANKQSK